MILFFKVLGGKGVGKSTFLRYVANRILAKKIEGCSKVLYVDLDPGQAELVIPGCVAATILSRPLLGPNFCNLEDAISPRKKIVFNVGEISMSNCRDRYLLCLKRLLQEVESDPELSSVPMLINTMGFNKGLGLLFIKETLRMFCPTTVVSLKSRFGAKNYHMNFDPGSLGLAYNLLEFEAVPEGDVQKMQAGEVWGNPEPRYESKLQLNSQI